jgi:hypothetical protein
MREGKIFDDACGWTLRCINYAAGDFKKHDVERALRALGWTPRSERQEGGDAK